MIPRTRPRKSRNNGEAPSKRQTRWKTMANEDPDKFDEISEEIVERVERALLAYMKTNDRKKQKACMDVMRKNYPTLRDLLLIGLIDDSTLMKTLGTLFQPTTHK